MAKGTKRNKTPSKVLSEVPETTISAKKDKSEPVFSAGNVSKQEFKEDVKITNPKKKKKSKKVNKESRSQPTNTEINSKSSKSTFTEKNKIIGGNKIAKSLPSPAQIQNVVFDENEKSMHISETKEFFRISTKIYLTLPPCYSDDLTTGINEFLNSYMMKYLDSLNGIILSHNNTKVLQDKGLVRDDSPFINFWITTDFLVWRPSLGSKISGTVQLQSVDHISLLLHGTFNAVILASDIPTFQYKWVGENDESEGEWINIITQKPLADSGTLEFYVKSLSTPQDALTVNGSLSHIEPK